MRRAVQSACLAAATLSGAACARPALPALALPTGPGVPAPSYSASLETARARCRDIRTLSADLSLQGHVGNQKLRGRVLVGLAADALRLEVLAPGGSAAIIFVADGSRGRLLLARDRRLLDDAPPADILDALVGLAMGPEDLRALLSGCLQASVEPRAARAYGAEWIAVDLIGSDVIYLRLGSDGSWRIAAGTFMGLTIQYGELANGVPSQVHLVSAALPGHPPVDLAIALSQVDVDGDSPDRSQLVTLIVPPGTSPITLQELRESYHR